MKISKGWSTSPKSFLQRCTDIGTVCLDQYLEAYQPSPPLFSAAAFMLLTSVFTLQDTDYDDRTHYVYSSGKIHAFLGKISLNVGNFTA